MPVGLSRRRGVGDRDGIGFALLATAFRRWAVLAELVLPELPVQRRTIHAEDTGCRPLVAVGPLERLDDRLALDLGERQLPLIGRWRPVARSLLRRITEIVGQMFGENLRTLRDDDGAFNDVFELPHVA